MSSMAAGRKFVHKKELLRSILAYLHICIFIELVLMSTFPMLLLFSHIAKDRILCQSLSCMCCVSDEVLHCHMHRDCSCHTNYDMLCMAASASMHMAVQHLDEPA